MRDEAAIHSPYLDNQFTKCHLAGIAKRHLATPPVLNNLGFGASVFQIIMKVEIVRGRMSTAYSMISGSKR